MACAQPWKDVVPSPQVVVEVRMASEVVVGSCEAGRLGASLQLETN
jgi:hypothetical protein